ncbi:MOSC domain-containing protein [Deinococcus planocerae]|uniref:MOSC domain-containing protein n=1 Tax=Deinococcus planocerae TaxID=1737569 RepID=UPI000C7E9C24|nr:MOSC domain-containing protein [Deinococcus planocerae]
MRLLSVNVAQPREHRVIGKPATTGIHKEPQPGAVHVGRQGLAGDHIADVANHGGPDQAVYLYSAEDYDWWAERLGEALEPGTLGENLTLSSFGPGPVRVGDRYRVGEALLEVTSPRIPCATLAARMGDPAFVKKFRQARRPGFYARVLVEGKVRAGDGVERVLTSAHTPTILDLFELFYERSPSPDTLRRALAAPVAVRNREEYEEQLRNLDRG